MQAAQLIGMTQGEAEALIILAGLRSRVKSIDGVGQVGDASARYDRINLFIKDGKVEKVSYG